MSIPHIETYPSSMSAVVCLLSANSSASLMHYPVPNMSMVFHMVGCTKLTKPHQYTDSDLYS